MSKKFTQAAGIYEQNRVCSEDVKGILEERKTILDSLIANMQESLKKAPSGRLRISECNNKKQYYHCNNSEGGTGVYIPKEKRNYACRLAQKSYDEKVMREAKKESDLLQKMIVYYEGRTVDKVFGSLSEGRKELVQPIEEGLEKYVREWSGYKYQGKDFAEEAAELYTDQGERVRSKSELIIANILCKNNIPYRYECPVELKGYGTVYPDFTILDVKRRKEILWEHLGMMDDPVYAEQAVRKIQSYMANGFYPGDNLILTAETRLQPLNLKIVHGVIDRYCLF